MSFGVKSKLLHHIKKEHNSADLGYDLVEVNSQGRDPKPHRIVREISQTPHMSQVPLIFQNTQVPPMFQAQQIPNVVAPMAEINVPNTLNQESPYLKVQCAKVQYVYMN